ncbi:MAG: type II toxin-antitoxin system RelE/ParE family toxin [Lachnospiraceae bacterium]|nr:type II toxin-antitoxin system RelE/ParE family toxin [Lachnospiraceae bacterium]
MKKLEYSPLVRNKLKALKEWLIEHFDEETALSVLAGIVSDADLLSDDPELGTNISETYDVETEYRYFFTHQHYLIYRIESGKVIIVQMFNEKEDFMMSLLGMSGRTQESIDYWGE